MLTTTIKVTDLQAEQQIHFVKQYFSRALSSALQLHPVFAPLYVKQGTGINDDLNGVETPVTFRPKGSTDTYAIVHSLAKWKRLRLKELGIAPYEGIITDMLALRPDEQLSPIHSILVDQWDWEMVIAATDRTQDFLKNTVDAIYKAIYATAQAVTANYPDLSCSLPEQIFFIQTEDLLQLYPDQSPKERENIIVKKYGAVFLMGIGGRLSNGTPHDGRAADYDDWSSTTSDGYKGLNGDILLWNPQLEQAFEISSMGIRVDKKALLHQLALSDTEHRKELLFHRAVLNEEVPYSIGGGIGQSRLVMFLLQQAHISAVQSNY